MSQRSRKTKSTTAGKEHLAELHDDAFTFARWQERDRNPAKLAGLGGAVGLSHFFFKGV